MRFAAMLALGLVALAPAQARASCIVGVAERTTSALGSIPAGALVVASPLETDVAPRGARRSRSRERARAPRRGARRGTDCGRAACTATSRASTSARSIAARASRLVYVRVQIQKGQLRVTVDAYPTVQQRMGSRAPAAAAAERARLRGGADRRRGARVLSPDSARARQGDQGDRRRRLTSWRRHAAISTATALAEILLVGRQRVALARLRAGKLDVARTVAWSALAKRAPVPLREPLGGAEIDVGGALVGSSDRGAVALDANLASPRPLAGGHPRRRGPLRADLDEPPRLRADTRVRRPAASRHGTGSVRRGRGVRSRHARWERTSS